MKYHEDALKLLSLKGRHVGNSELDEFARELGIVIPESFYEWATLEQAWVIGKYSNGDHFEFSRPILVELNDGQVGLKFCTENQGNFQIAVLLNNDDPEVVYSWLGQEPWITHAKSFSSYVYAHLFDWQYALEFDHEGYAGMAYQGFIELKNDNCIPIIRRDFEETVQTSYVVYEDIYQEFRFITPRFVRVNVLVAKSGKTSIKISGEYNKVLETERELICRFCTSILPEEFSHYSSIVRYLDYCLRRNQLEKIQAACLVRPKIAAVEKLASGDRLNR